MALRRGRLPSDPSAFEQTGVSGPENGVAEGSVAATQEPWTWLPTQGVGDGVLPVVGDALTLKSNLSQSAISLMYEGGYTVSLAMPVMSSRLSSAVSLDPSSEQLGSDGMPSSASCRISISPATVVLNSGFSSL